MVDTKLDTDLARMKEAWWNAVGVFRIDLRRMSDAASGQMNQPELLRLFFRDCLDNSSLASPACL